MPNSLSELHTLHAWEDNQITERCTQGEYAGKVLQFKLVDKIRVYFTGSGDFQLA